MATETDSSLPLKEDCVKEKLMNVQDSTDISNIGKIEHSLENGDTIKSLATAQMNGDANIVSNKINDISNNEVEESDIEMPEASDRLRKEGISENGNSSSKSNSNRTSPVRKSDNSLTDITQRDPIKITTNSASNNGDTVSDVSSDSFCADKLSKNSSSVNNVEKLTKKNDSLVIKSNEITESITQLPNDSSNYNSDNKNSDEVTSPISEKVSSSNAKESKEENDSIVELSDCPSTNVSELKSPSKENQPSVEDDSEEFDTSSDQTPEKKEDAQCNDQNTKEDESKSGDGVEEESRNKEESQPTDLSTEKKEELISEQEKKAKSKKNKKKKEEVKTDFVKRVTRSASGVCKQIRYTDPELNFDIEDDDIKITKEVPADENDDILMIEQSDPLAISDADVRKAKEAKKEASNYERLKSSKAKESKDAKSKDNSNVIIIDTNTLLKSSPVTPVQQTPPPPRPAPVQNHHHPQPTSTPSTTPQNSVGITTSPITTVQAAIQAITGGSPAIQGLQSAYLNAIQQVLAAQGSSQLNNPHYIATLQQYYNTLGALQDDAYVIEAPSFIVPYVMEGNPKENIKSFLKRINKEQQEFEKKQKEKELKDEEDKNEKDQISKDNGSEELDTLDKKEKEIINNEVKEKSDDESKSISDERCRNDESKGEKEQIMEVDKESKELEANTPKNSEEKIEENEEKLEKDKTEEKEIEKGANKEEASKDHTKEEDKNKKETKEANKDADKENSDKSKGEKKSSDSTKDEDIVEIKDEPKEDLSHLGRWENYYRSSLGKFILELGLDQVQEFIQSDLLRMQRKRMDKKTIHSKEDTTSLKLLERQLKIRREKNKHLTLPLSMCRFCSYKTESNLVMERHLESPHMMNYTYKCNFCEFETRGPQVILLHVEAEHNIRGRLERAPAFFQCSLCPFEDNNKSKMTRHSLSCAKKFKPEKNCDLSDWEPPAKIPKIMRGRSGASSNAGAFGKNIDSMRFSNILPKNLGALGLNLQSVLSSGLLNSAVSAAAAAGNLANRGGRGSLLYQNRGSLLHGVSSAQQLNVANQVLQSVTQNSLNRSRMLNSSSASGLIPGLAASSSITIQSVQNKSGSTKSPQQPSISITPLPRAGGQPASGTKSVVGSPSNSSRPTFVICEICDGYIKDLEQLRNHMNLIHKVKIHPKMIYNRPPLNCQKCQHRFFTDQGLERHLLGTHGLVTSSMQEAANKGKDAGRCPICGKVFQWKLLNHVSRDHKMTLKPAHLSYKCTVCTATFNMYRLFENHVYSAHSVVGKNKSDSGTSNSSSSGNTTANSSSSSSSNKKSEPPLKINDEITIIPQPASKSQKDSAPDSPGSGGSSASKSSKKTESSPSVSKEITITKVGGGSRSSSTPSNGNNKKSGNGVEVISLDESPQKRPAPSDDESTSSPAKKKARETFTSKKARNST